ncbi:MAG TPA: hypothetical protein VH062_04030 [Polyangiaceae bacterium]|jgi:hypothetical protein|nr:hypothetical protein [Polyangiaceae bacterium]
MRHVKTTALILCSTFLSAHARANGNTLMPGGTASVSRGGAIAARPEDATAMATDPAGLAFLSGNTVALDVALPVAHMCVNQYGYYGWGITRRPGTDSEFGNSVALGANNYAATPLGGVCNSAPTTPLPSIGWTGHVAKNLVLGFGFLEPVLVPGMQFGGTDGTVQTPYGARPTPTRYALIKQEALYASAPSLAVAYRFIPELAAGLTVQVIGIEARQTQVQHPTGGTSPSADALATVTTQDLFIPALAFSVHARPIPALNLIGTFKWSDDFRGTGDVAYETNTYFHGKGLANIPFKNDPISLSDVTVRLPWELIAGIRYAGLLKGNQTKGSDPMATERWDVEVDFDYSFTQRTGTDSVTLGAKANYVTHTAAGGVGTSTVDPNDIGTLNVDSHLRNTYALRAGGSFSVLPRKFAVLAGIFYENRGVDLAYADVTSMAFQRVGTSVGMLFRFGDWDLRLGATHIASETVTVAPARGQDVITNEAGTGKVALPDPSAPSPGQADAVAAKHQSASNSSPIINAGRYTASFDVLSAGFAYHF